jgi:hypothetical protein
MVDLNPDIRRTGFFGCSKENSVEFGFTTIQRRHTVKFPRLSGMPFYGIGSPPLHTSIQTDEISIKPEANRNSRVLFW